MTPTESHYQRYNPKKNFFFVKGEKSRRVNTLTGFISVFVVRDDGSTDPTEKESLLEHSVLQSEQFLSKENKVKT